MYVESSCHRSSKWICYLPTKASRQLKRDIMGLRIIIHYHHITRKYYYLNWQVGKKSVEHCNSSPYCQLTAQIRKEMDGICKDGRVCLEPLVASLRVWVWHAPITLALWKALSYSVFVFPFCRNNGDVWLHYIYMPFAACNNSLSDSNV